MTFLTNIFYVFISFHNPAGTGYYTKTIEFFILGNHGMITVTGECETEHYGLTVLH